MNECVLLHIFLLIRVWRKKDAVLWCYNTRTLPSCYFMHVYVCHFICILIHWFLGVLGPPHSQTSSICARGPYRDALSALLIIWKSALPMMTNTSTPSTMGPTPALLSESFALLVTVPLLPALCWISLFLMRIFDAPDCVISSQIDCRLYAISVINVIDVDIEHWAINN